jgi:hypothetical protein
MVPAKDRRRHGGLRAPTDRIARWAKRYTLVEGDLYWHGINGVLMRCIT